MRLTDFCKSKGETGTPSCPVLIRMAKCTAITSRTLYMVARGHIAPSARLCKRVEAYTEGAVSGGDLRPDIFGKAGAPAIARHDGYALVPVKITPAMAVAMARAWSNADRPIIVATAAQNAWDAALAVRPEVASEQR